MLNSYELVKSLEKRKIWQEYMTKNECRILKEALKSSDTFTQFMNQSNFKKKEKILIIHYYLLLYNYNLFSIFFYFYFSAIQVIFKTTIIFTIIIKTIY